MQAKYDKQAQALYLQLQEGKVKSTVKLRADLLVDVDENDQVLGVEFLHPEKFFPEISKSTQIPLSVT
ncbi:TPA: hypothetical protein DIS56_01140 [Candidatus Saccharibacteria bacterium]|nr:hypothetical protein [Candidatus Saccharibacteria bacterium]